MNAHTIAWQMLHTELRRRVTGDDDATCKSVVPPVPLPARSSDSAAPAERASEHAEISGT
jgi:hypothetical protein